DAGAGIGVGEEVRRCWGGQGAIPRSTRGGPATLTGASARAGPGADIDADADAELNAAATDLDAAARTETEVDVEGRRRCRDTEESRHRTSRGQGPDRHVVPRGNRRWQQPRTRRLTAS